jgi:hypothetical protein
MRQQHQGGGDLLTNKCSCGAVYRDVHNLEAHVKAMEERNATLPANPAKDDANRREDHHAID